MTDVLWGKGEEMELIDYWICLTVLRSICNSMEEWGNN